MRAAENNAERKRLQALAELADPPEGDSWVDYATMHQHVGGPCWKCVARKKALAEHERLRRVEAAVRPLLTQLRDESTYVQGTIGAVIGALLGEDEARELRAALDAAGEEDGNGAPLLPHSQPRNQ